MCHMCATQVDRLDIQSICISQHALFHAVSYFHLLFISIESFVCYIYSVAVIFIFHYCMCAPLLFLFNLYFCSIQYS